MGLGEQRREQSTVFRGERISGLPVLPPAVRWRHPNISSRSGDQSRTSRSRAFGLAAGAATSLSRLIHWRRATGGLPLSCSGRRRPEHDADSIHTCDKHSQVWHCEPRLYCAVAQPRMRTARKADGAKALAHRLRTTVAKPAAGLSARDRPDQPRAPDAPTMRAMPARRSPISPSKMAEPAPRSLMSPTTKARPERRPAGPSPAQEVGLFQRLT